MALAKGVLESCTLTLIGEVSEVSNKPGYKAVYFTVKDEGASLPAMMWMNRFQAAGIELTVGMLVQLTGRFTLYAPKGRMNFDVFSLTLAGEGDLRQRVAQLAKKLQAEGLMDPLRKRNLPPYPHTIGLVTSPRGAAVHDVLRTLRRRFPSAKVLLAGVPVEGTQAASYLASGIECVAQAGAEVVLLVRGGGSFEDLMPFNDESLARCIAACPVPLVTGIGHEPDNSIADMVADFRASTPTAAAEAITPDAFELSASLASCASQLNKTLLSRLDRSQSVLDNYASRPVLHNPNQLLATPAQSLDIALERLSRAIPTNLMRDKAALSKSAVQLQSFGRTFIEFYKARISTAASRLDDLSPLSILARGYSLVKDEDDALVKEVSQAKAGDKLVISVSDGTIHTTVDFTELSNREVFTWKDD